MTRASYSATPLLRSLVHRPQGVILVRKKPHEPYNVIIHQKDAMFGNERASAEEMSAFLCGFRDRA